MCSVVDCHNNYFNTGPDIKFYSFPSRPHEKDRRKEWIRKIRRENVSGRGDWEPKKHNRICSAHFVGNKKSNHPKNPAYHPTIFPAVYKITQVNTATNIECYNRIANRRNIKNIKENNAVMDSQVELSETSNIITTKEVSCQTSSNLCNELEYVSFAFKCALSSEKNEISTQACIPLLRGNHLKSSTDKCIGNDTELSCECFHGYKSIKSNSELNSLAGVTFERFDLLFSLLQVVVHGNDKISIQNKLLLFLMKMKLDISFTALGVLFGVHCSTVSRIFVNILTELYHKTQNYIYWPSKDVIRLTMPKAFTINYPNCRAIIDCTELRIELPSAIDNRIYTYSNYKGCFTSKLLIAIAPNGFITYLSKCYGGRTSDTFITNNCGILNLFESEDVILADKGFPGIKCDKNSIIVMPPFLHNGMLSYDEVIETYSIASVRIHVERSIQRLKMYNILQKIPTHLFPYLDMIVVMCGVLTNLQPPTIKGHPI